jgi:hypothetical protein
MGRPGDSDATDPLDAIGAAGAALADHRDPAVRRVGQWLAEGADAALFSYLTDQDIQPGYSPRAKAVLEKRDRLIQALGAGYSAAELDAEVDRYRTRGGWPRDRLKTRCPYGADDRRAMIWEVLQLRGGHFPGVKQLDRILRGQEIASVVRRPAVASARP